jgi:sugar/nucleoside kinase (ribokinase family)
MSSTPIDEKTYDVIGIGNAIVDVISACSEEFITHHQMKKGTMALIDEARAEELYDEMGAATECSGGSVANSLAGLAQLGAKTAFMGKVRNDQLGRIFRHDMQAIGIHFVGEPAVKGKPTARCLICVTPDGQRTMNTYIGACADVLPEDINGHIIAQGKYLFIEGYLWDQPHAKQAIRQAIELAQQHNTKIAFSLSDVFCVERHRTEFQQLVAQACDVVFANEHELQSLYELPSLEENIAQLRTQAALACVTRSEKGSLLITADQTLTIAAEPVAQVVDSTGAGDLYAAGVLYGLTQGWSLEDAGKLGARCAADIIQQIGARSQKPLNRHLAA